MAIKAPAWCSHAIPTLNGWEDPDTGELFVSSGFNQDEIDEFFNVKASGMEVIKEVPEPEVETLIEAPVNDKGLDDMTKVELEALGRQHGVELDRRLKKETLLGQISKLLKS